MKIHAAGPAGITTFVLRSLSWEFFLVICIYYDELLYDFLL